MNVLNKLSEYHSRWLYYVKAIGGGDESEDIVQDMYLIMHKYPDKALLPNDIVNERYVLVVLRNLYYKLKQVELVELTENIEDTTEDYDFEHENLIIKIKQEIDNWHWYDKKIFELLKFEKMTMRELSEQTQISFPSIRNTARKGMDKLKKKF